MPLPLSRLRRALGRLLPGRADWRAMGWDGVLGALASAALLTLAFPRADLGGLVWVALVPVFAVTRAKPPRAARWLWYLFGVVWSYASLCWFNVTLYVNPLVLGGIVLLALVLGLWMLLFGWAVVWLRRLGPVHLLLVPMLWPALEYTHLFGELAFPWLYLAHTQHGVPVMIQSASFAGTWGLSFLIVAINLLLAEALALRFGRAASPAHWAPTVLGTLLWSALMAANLLLGQRALDRWNTPPTERAVRIAIVQPAWAQRDKLAAGEDPAIERDLFALLIDQLRRIEPGHTDLVLLPESVIIDFFFPLGSRVRLADLGQEARRLHAAVVFGANNCALRPGADPAADEIWPSDLTLRNSVWSLDASGEIVATYDKIRLVAFAESAPLVSLVPGLMQLTLGNLALFEPGEAAAPLAVHTPRGPVALGAHVCFESTFPNLVAEQVRSGAEILATVTNDAWFLDTAGPWQHWIVQPFRAVENRRWIVQAANTGPSSAVNPAGVVVHRSRLDHRTTLHADAEPLTTLTFYTRHGDWLARLFGVFSLAGLAAALWRRRSLAGHFPRTPP
ncbi:MAG: apolipoprotein N-acyltransferase [Candidatus Sumerlaeia bacterium]|nr:apolipoprotein N-acyltransferase [Candidatus Sumerlaeia bacterium]